MDKQQNSKIQYRSSKIESSECLNSKRSENNMDMKEQKDKYHVVSGDEGIIDGHELHIIALERDSSNQPPDPPKTYQQPRIKPKRSS